MWHIIKNDTNELVTKQKQTPHKSQNQTYGCQRENGGEVINQEIEVNIYTILNIKEITNKDSTGKSTQHSVITYM